MTLFETIISIMLTILILLIFWIGAVLNQYFVQTIELEWRWEEIRKRDEEAEKIQRWARKVEWTYPEEDGAFDEIVQDPMNINGRRVQCGNTFKLKKTNSCHKLRLRR